LHRSIAETVKSEFKIVATNLEAANASNTTLTSTNETLSTEKELLTAELEQKLEKAISTVATVTQQLDEQTSELVAAKSQISTMESELAGLRATLELSRRSPPGSPASPTVPQRTASHLQLEELYLKQRDLFEKQVAYTAGREEAVAHAAELMRQLGESITEMHLKAQYEAKQ
jgi:hypothetical protein